MKAQGDTGVPDRVAEDGLLAYRGSPQAKPGRYRLVVVVIFERRRSSRRFRSHGALIFPERD